MESAQVIQMHVLDMQVCVPSDWSNEQVILFAEKEYPCGTTNGWFIREEGNERLMGYPERAPCAERSGFVHIVLEA